MPRELPTLPLEADWPEEEPELRGELLIPEREWLSGSLKLRVAELPMPSSFRLPRSLRPLVLLELLERDDPPRSIAAAEYPLALLLPTSDRPRLPRLFWLLDRELPDELRLPGDDALMPLFLELLGLDELFFDPLFDPLEELFDEPLIPSP